MQAQLVEARTRAEARTAANLQLEKQLRLLRETHASCEVSNIVTVCASACYRRPREHADNHLTFKMHSVTLSLELVWISYKTARGAASALCAKPVC